MEPPETTPGAAVWPSTLEKSAHLPGFFAALVPEVAAAAEELETWPPPAAQRGAAGAGKARLGQEGRGCTLDSTDPKTTQHLAPAGHLERPAG